MALTKVTGDFIKAGSITQGHLHSSHGITTTHIAEGDKLFFTNARVDSRVGSLSTSNLSEGTNLYYTNARADARIALQVGSNLDLSSKSTSDLSEGTNLYYTQARFNTAFTAKSTSDLSEGTNLYYTDARADARITAADTDSLSEGSTNLYYTDARADARVALIVDSAPGTLNTLNELAEALGDDANFSTTVTNSIATKMPIAGGTFTGAVVGTSFSAPSGFINGSNGGIRIHTSGTKLFNITAANAARDNIMDIGASDARFKDLYLGGTITASGYNDSNWNTAYGWGDHGAAGYLTSFDITTQTDGKYIRSDADDTASGIITLTKNTASNIVNNAFSHAKTIIGGIHFANGAGANNNGKQAAITFQGGTASEAQAGIYVHNNNSQGTHMMFATTNSYATGPQAGITLLNNGNVTIRGTVGASNFSGSSSGTNTGDQTLPTLSSLGAAAAATTLAGYGITNAIQKGADITSGASWTTATKFNSTGNLSQAAGNHALSVNSANGNDAFMSFHIASDYAIHFGLDGATNRMHVGGWSDGTGTQYQLYDSRDFSVASVLNSNVTLASLGAQASGSYLTTSGKAADSNLLDGKDHTDFGATLATYGTTAGSSGRIRCTAPFNTNSGKMFQITISLYGSYTQHTYIVSAYMYSTSNQWYSPQAIYLGTGSPDIIVGRDANGKAYISIANGNYMGVRVHNMTRGYGTSVADTYDSWAITVDAGTENSVTPSIHKTWTSGNDGSGSGLDADLLDGQHASAFQAAGSYAPAGGSYGTDWYANALYHDDWVRNHTNTNGHYWSSTGWHLYPRNSEFFYLRSGLSTSTGLAMVCGNETIRGYVYADSGSNIGLLNNAGQWTLQCDNSKNVTAHGSSRAPIFYDSNNTAYYGDFASTSVMSRINVGNGDNPAIQCVANASYGAGTELEIGGWSTGTTVSKIRNSNGNLHMDSKSGNNMYLNHYPPGNILVGNGGGYLLAYQSMRSPIFYDSNDTGYYTNPASTSNVNAMTFAGVADFNGGHGGINITNTSILSSATSAWTGDPGGAGKIQYHSNRWYIVSDSSSNRIVQFRKNNLDKSYIDNDGRLIGAPDARAPIFYDSDDTAYYGDFASNSHFNTMSCAGGLLFGSNYGVGVTGLYTSTRIQTIFNMGAAYKLPDNGASTGSAYGLYWSHQNAGSVGGANNLASHGIIILEGGSYKGSWGGGRLVTPSDIRGTLFYDYSNTGYYEDPASTSNLNAATFAGDITVNGNQVITLGGNADVKFSVWSGTTYGIGMTSGVTLGNLNDYAMTFCMNNDADRGFWWGYSGQSKGAGAMSLTTNGKLYVTTQVTAPIFYDTNTAYYIDPASTSNTVNMYAVTQMRAPIYYSITNTAYYTRPHTSSYINTLHTAGQIQVGSSGSSQLYLGNTSGNYFRFHTNNSDTYFDANVGDIYWRQGSSTRYIFHMNNATMTVYGTITQHSDIRLKENIITIDSALDKVKKLRGVYYNRKDISLGKQIGLIAQEVEDVVPEVVKTIDDDFKTKSIAYAQLNALLVEAIKEQQTIIDDLKSRLETLENQ